MNKPEQRFYTLDEALTIIASCISHLNMDFSWQQLGCIDTLPTYLCLINHHQQRLSFRGAGSGSFKEARVKAIYEAVEDCLFYQTLCQHHADYLFMFSTKTTPSLGFMQEHELLPQRLKQPDYLKNPYPWLKLQKLHTPKLIYYPLSLLFPQTGQFSHYNKHVNQSPLTPLANTTGLAMGATATESLLHGINDWIERDAYGIFLLHTLLKRKQPIRCINKESLPDTIKQDITLIETTYADELILVDISTNLNIPAFLVSFSRQPVPVQPSGLGAALSKTQALKQALFEALQARDRYNENTVAARYKTIQHYKNYPLLQQAYIGNLTVLLDDKPIIKDWKDLPNPVVHSNLDDQLTQLAQLLENKGCDIYHQTLFKNDLGLTLSYVLLTGVETFGMIREGLFLPVKKRGVEYESTF